DDSAKSIGLVTKTLVDAVLEAKAVLAAKREEEVKAEEEKEQEEA
nr:30S ribosomal protein S2 [Candidatus Saccharibacteria bacterium]NIV03081.1 30S ribosomal protein S2 [Calditrichia bacterium]NIV72732.1 30S ribosomal protein S2 [Calditrichia bacterium]NIV98092.1 30S ribosomal protein S2 [Candidatus Saccharibacteria bacterium]NIW78379.1 30S ribosomal protein S2 [Calditrichia bacterium]